MILDGGGGDLGRGGGGKAGWGFCHRHMSPRGPRDARRPARRQLDTAPEDVKITTRVMGTRRHLRPGAERLGGRPGSRGPLGLVGVGGRQGGRNRQGRQGGRPPTGTRPEQRCGAQCSSVMVTLGCAFRRAAGQQPQGPPEGWGWGLLTRPACRGPRPPDPPAS